MDTSAASGEQVSTWDPVDALGKSLLLAPPGPSLSLRAALPVVLNKCTIGRHPHVLPVMPRPTCRPSQPFCSYQARLSVPAGSNDEPPRPLRRPAPRAAVGRPPPEPPARPENPLQTVSRQPDPLWGSGWRETVPPFTPTNSPTTPRLVQRPPRRFQLAASASETPRRMISAGFLGDR